MSSMSRGRFGVSGLALLAAVALAGCMQSQAMTGGPAEQTVMVGGEAMYPTKTIVENAVNSKDHTTLVAAVTEAGLVETLSGPGPFTVFAPTNRAFDALPPGTVETLMTPANKGQLTTVLTYHVVPGRLDAAELRRMVAAGGGRAQLTTASGGTLTVMANGPTNLMVVDANGGHADISTYDVHQSNGVIHVVDRVLLPAM